MLRPHLSCLLLPFYRFKKKETEEEEELWKRAGSVLCCFLAQSFLVGSAHFPVLHTFLYWRQLVSQSEHTNSPSCLGAAGTSLAKRLPLHPVATGGTSEEEEVHPLPPGKPRDLAGADARDSMLGHTA